MGMGLPRQPYPGLGAQHGFDPPGDSTKGVDAILGHLVEVASVDGWSRQRDPTCLQMVPKLFVEKGQCPPNCGVFDKILGFQMIRMIYWLVVSCECNRIICASSIVFVSASSIIIVVIIVVVIGGSSFCSCFCGVHALQVKGQNCVMTLLSSP